MGLFGKRHDDWPTAIATVDEVTYDPEDGITVDISGSFKVVGEFYSAIVELVFNSTKEAADWGSYMENKPTVTVRYNPENPADNFIEGLPPKARVVKLT